MWYMCTKDRPTLHWQYVIVISAYVNRWSRPSRTEEQCRKKAGYFCYDTKQKVIIR